MDVICSFNSTHQGWQKYVEYPKYVVQNKSVFNQFSDRGDFIASLGRNVRGDQHLVNTFRRHLQGEEGEKGARFENFRMENMNSQVSGRYLMICTLHSLFVIA